MRPVRGIRFEGAGLGEGVGGAATGPGVSPAGALLMAEGDEAIRQSLLLLLTTAPGERVMRPDYGCPIHQLVFSPNDATTAGLAIHYVRQAVTRWEPRVDIVRLDAGADPEDPGRLAVTLDYRVRASGAERELALALPLDGRSG